MFLLVPVHTGCPGQNSESRKMVACVFVSLCYVAENYTNYPTDATWSNVSEEGWLNKNYVSVCVVLVVHSTY